MAVADRDRQLRAVYSPIYLELRVKGYDEVGALAVASAMHPFNGRI